MDEQSQNIIKIALIIMLMVVVIVIILALLGPAMGTLYSNITPNL